MGPSESTSKQEAGAFDPREVVARKRDGLALSDEELRQFVLRYARDEVPDYLASAFLMAAYLRELSPAETVSMTRAMIDSGMTLSLAGVGKPKVDKHSTGGVGDGVTLVFAPLAASLGVAVAKLSGRALGHTGGTLDKLESIPGLRTDLSPDELERQVDRVGCAVAAQSADLVPADGKLYALRDATATIGSIPLIAASVMSKKLAVRTDLILLDVKAGGGAFMRTVEDASKLARACTNLAREWDRECRAAVTDMSQPLGVAIGNALEVAECVSVLKGEDRGRLRQLAVVFGTEAASSLLGLDPARATAEAESALDSGAAAAAFARMVESQGGDPRVVEDPWGVLPRAPVRAEISPPTEGWLAAVDAEAVGMAAVSLGAGRLGKGDEVDSAVGIELFPKIGDRLETGRPVGWVHARSEMAAEAAVGAVGRALKVSGKRVEPVPLLHGWTGSGDGLSV